MSDVERDLALGWMAEISKVSADRDAAIHTLYQRYENAGLINRVILARYRCRRGCGLATVIRAGDLILARTRDYHYSPGMNAAQSVLAARKKNTLDGDSHWPGHTFDVHDFARSGPAANVTTNCSHTARTLLVADILAAIEGVERGRPRKPILL